jgi:transcriptional regulator with GAF, ATPase, and Fis domain
MLESYERFCGFLDLPIDKVIAKTHEFSVTAARQTIVEGAWQPAGRLILTHDKCWNPPQPENRKQPAQATTAPEMKPEAPSPLTASKRQTTADSIKQLLKTPGINQSQLLNTCLQGLHDEQALSRVSLMLLSGDRQSIQNRATVGIDPDSPFKRYKIELARSGLFKILLSKPQAIWINRDSFKKYHKLIPADFLASSMTENFMAMSLFIGHKPIGIVYADRRESGQDIEQTSFDLFKQLVSLTSKALTLLSKR